MNTFPLESFHQNLPCSNLPCLKKSKRWSKYSDPDTLETRSTTSSSTPTMRNLNGLLGTTSFLWWKQSPLRRTTKKLRITVTSSNQVKCEERANSLVLREELFLTMSVIFGGAVISTNFWYCQKHLSTKNNWWMKPVVERLVAKVTRNEVVCTIYVGVDLTPVPDCKLSSPDKTMKLEGPVKPSDGSEELDNERSRCLSRS